MSELPNGWTPTHAIEIATPIRGVTYKKEQSYDKPSPGYTAVLRANNIQKDKIYISDLVYVPDECISNEQRLLENDIVIAMSSGSASVVGKTAQVAGELDASFGAFCGALRPSHFIEARYLGHFLKSDAYRSRISELARGVNINNLKWSHFEEIEIPLAPLPEQKRIADKLDTLLARIDACRDRLDRIPKIIKQFRQSVLAAATSGRLTEDWRAAQEADRVARMQPQAESGMVARDAAQCRYGNTEEPESRHSGASRNPVDAPTWTPAFAGVTEKPAFPYQATHSPDSAALHPGYGTVDHPGFEKSAIELPSTWRICQIKDVGRIQLGRQRSPKFHAGGNMRPYLRVQNVFEDRLDLSDVMEMDFPGQDIERYQLHPGDILLNEGQSPEFLGRPAMYRGELPGVCFTNTLIRFQTYPHVKPEFALIVFRNHMHSGRYRSEGTITTNIAHLGAGRFSNIEFPLPALAEQSEIVRRVESLFALADRLEARVATARARVASLTPATLAKAFRGELVPQDPNDEPAAVLLERIRAERAAQPAQRGRRAGKS